MKSLYFSVLLLFVPIAVIAAPPVSGEHNSSQILSAGTLIYSDEFSFVYNAIYARDERDNEGQFLSTEVTVYEGSEQPDGIAYRQLACSVPQNVLKVWKAGANLEVLLDADSESCASSGFICDADFVCDYSNHSYTGVIPVSAQLSKPIDQLDEGVVQTWKYSDGTSGSNRCTRFHASADGYFSVAGEKTVIVNGDNVSGVYELNSCNLRSKE